MGRTVNLAEYQALAEFRYQIRRFLNFSEQAARAANLEPQQYLLLLMIRGLPEGKEATISTLAERLQIKHHSTVELVDRLVKLGLVERGRAEQDRREVIITLTPSGEKILSRLALQRLEELRSGGPSLVRALDALIAAIEESAIKLVVVMSAVQMWNS